MEHVAEYLLDQVFAYAHQAACYELAGLLFGERIMKIDPAPGFKPPLVPETLPAWMKQRERKEEDNDDNDPTIGRLSDAWQQAQKDAVESEVRLEKTTGLRPPTRIP